MIDFDTPFCDYLTVTFSDETGTPLEELADFLPRVGLICSYDSLGVEYWCSVSVVRERLTFRKCLLVKRHGASGLLVTVYGSGLEFFRECQDRSSYSEFLSILSSYRHNLTRLDVAMDIPVDTPEFFLDFLPKVSSGLFALRRDTLRVLRVISVRDDGLESGTVYIGKGSNARAKCTVYDKQLERLIKTGDRIKPRTRIEFRLAKDFGVSLFDALSPASLFWELAYPKILTYKPEDIPEWTKRQGFSRLPQQLKQREVNHYEVLKGLIYDNPLFSTLISYSDKHIGEGGRKYLINTISRLINNPAMGLDVKD
ncbi:hypothetical protein M1V20_004941 [Escherichia coli]|nr:hypothetical protein [Escherichia coli]